MVNDKIKLERMNILASFIEYHKRQAESKIKELYLLAHKEEGDRSKSYLPPPKASRNAENRYVLPVVEAEDEGNF